MRFQHFFMVALLSFGCAVNAQDDVLADALFTQGEQKLREAKTEEDHKVVFDLMKRAGIDVATVGIGGKNIKSAHGLSVTAEISESEVDFEKHKQMIIEVFERLLPEKSSYEK